MSSSTQPENRDRLYDARDRVGEAIEEAVAAIGDDFTADEIRGIIAGAACDCLCRRAGHPAPIPFEWEREQ